MTWIISNWYLFVILAIVIAQLALTIKLYFNKPTEEKIEKFKEWLLFAVMKAEKELGAGTGQFKLRYVYDLALEQFPSLTLFISFEQFSSYVDEALDKFKAMLSSNKSIQEYVGTDKA